MTYQDLVNERNRLVQLIEDLTSTIEAYQLYNANLSGDQEPIDLELDYEVLASYENELGDVEYQLHYMTNPEDYSDEE